jgi:sirohydrochlorin cobaltochelatase
MTSLTSPPGLILFAQGAGDTRWAGPFEAVAVVLRAQRPDVQVRLAFLEFMNPALPAAGAELAAAGCRQVSVLPTFLGAGSHVRKDLPLLMDQVRKAHPGVEFSLHPAVGEMPSVTSAMAGVALSLMAAGDPPGP